MTTPSLPSPSEFVIVALAEPLGIGRRFDRDAWPAHVTVVGNFRTIATTEEVATVIARNAVAFRPLSVVLGAPAMFGRGADVPVLLADSPSAIELHGSLVRDLHGAIPYSPVDPDHWGAGFRPHLTLISTVTAREGEVWTPRSIALVQLEGHSAVSRHELLLPPSWTASEQGVLDC